MVVCGMSVEGSLVGPDRGQLRWIGRVVVFILPDRKSALLTVGLQSSELCDIGRAPLLVRVTPTRPACLIRQFGLTMNCLSAAALATWFPFGKVPCTLGAVDRDLGI